MGILNDCLTLLRAVSKKEESCDLRVTKEGNGVRTRRAIKVLRTRRAIRTRTARRSTGEGEVVGTVVNIAIVTRWSNDRRAERPVGNVTARPNGIGIFL